MADPYEMTSQIVKICAHPLRIQILGFLDKRTASTREIADALGVSPSTVRYHVQRLAAARLLKPVERPARGRAGAARYYTAAYQPRLPAPGWDELPEHVKRSFAAGVVRESADRAFAALAEGGFDHEDARIVRREVRLVRESWEAVSRALEEARQDIERSFAEAAERIAHDPDAVPVESTVILSFYESPRGG